MDLGNRLAAVNSVAVGLLSAAVGCGVVLGLLVGDGSKREWLFALSGSFEAFGVLLVASPEIAPYLQRGRRGLAAAWERIKQLGRKLRRVFGRRQDRTVHAVPGGEVSAAGRVRARVSPNPDATLEEKVDYLLRRDQDVQARFDANEERLGALPGEWRADIADASSELREEHAKALEALRDRHLAVRLLGVALLGVGIALATWGNLV